MGSLWETLEPGTPGTDRGAIPLCPIFIVSLKQELVWAKLKPAPNSSSFLLDVHNSDPLFYTYNKVFYKVQYGPPPLFLPQTAKQNTFHQNFKKQNSLKSPHSSSPQATVP